MALATKAQYCARQKREDWLNDLGYYKQELRNKAHSLEAKYRKTLSNPEEFTPEEIKQAELLQELDGRNRRIHSAMIIKSQNCMAAAQDAIFRAVNDGRHWPANWERPRPD